MVVHTDLSASVITTAPSPATSGTTVVVTDAVAANLPDVYPWYGVFVPTGARPTRSNAEIVKVTAGSSSGGNTTYTITRAQGVPVTIAQTVTTGFDFYEAADAQREINRDSGWSELPTLTYVSADVGTGVATCVGDFTAIVQAGDRIKLTQTTAKYFIVTKVPTFATGVTTFTFWGGTDFTLANAAITLPFYSHQKNPFGFNTSPIKWTATTTSTANDNQASPAQNTWYNVGTRSLAVPIGVWDLSYEAIMYVDGSGSLSRVLVQIALSTANNSASDQLLVGSQDISFGALSNPGSQLTVKRNKHILLTSKTSYYLNARTTLVNMGAVGIRGDVGTTVIKAVSAYL